MMHIAEQFEFEGFDPLNSAVTPEQEYERWLDQVRQWCDQEHGRRVDIARELGCSPALVTLWLKGERMPTAVEFLKIRRFLRRKSTR